MDLVPAEPPEWLDADGLRWARTEIARGADLVNGKEWMNAFSTRCEAAKAAAAVGPSEGRRRLLRQVASTGDEPQFWAKQGDLANSDRNRVLDSMAQDGLPRPGRRVRLSTGEDVIFWFNVGQNADQGPPAARVMVTAARCPHQGVCLADGELKEIEDLAGQKKAVVRCPRHNRLFNIATGEGEGNDQKLQIYRAQFHPEYRRFYVAVGPANLVPVLDMSSQGHAEMLVADDDAMDVEEPDIKRVKTDVPTPARLLKAHNTIC